MLRLTILLCLDVYISKLKGLCFPTIELRAEYGSQFINIFYNIQFIGSDSVSWRIKSKEIFWVKPIFMSQSKGKYMLCRPQTYAAFSLMLISVFNVIPYDLLFVSGEEHLMLCGDQRLGRWTCCPLEGITCVLGEFLSFLIGLQRLIHQLLENNGNVITILI